jgi:hypothetical protein
VAGLAYDVAVIEPPNRLRADIFSHWRVLLTAIAPGVAAAVTARALLTASAAVVVADGSFVAEPGWQDYVGAVIWVLGWTLSLSAAMAVMRGVLQGEPVSAGAAVRLAVRRYGWALAAVMVTVVTTGLVLFPAWLIQTTMGPIGVFVYAVAIVLACASIGLLPLAVLDGEDPFTALRQSWRAAVGHRTRMVGYTLAVGLPGLAIAWLLPRLQFWGYGAVWALVRSMIFTLVIVVVIAVQGSLLARWYANRNGSQSPLGSPPQPARWPAGLGLLTAAVLLGGAVVVANPWGVPVLSSNQASATDKKLANGDALLPDGRAIEAETMVDALTKTGTYSYASEARAAGDGLVIVAAIQTEDNQGQSATMLVLWHCPTTTCEGADRTVLDPYLSIPGDSDYRKLQLAVGVDQQGRPVVAWGLEESRVALVRCDSAACGHPTTDYLSMATLVDGQWPKLAGLGFDAQAQPVAALTWSFGDGYGDNRSAVEAYIADRPEPDPLIVTVTCTSDHCADKTIRRWHAPGSLSGKVFRPVAAADGSVSLIEDVTANGDDAYLIRCERNCG